MIQEVKPRKLHCFMPNTLTALHRVRHSTTPVIETLKPWPKRCDARSQHYNALKILRRMGCLQNEGLRPKTQKRRPKN